MKVYEIDRVNFEGAYLAMHPMNKSVEAYERKLDGWINANRAHLGLDASGAWPFANVQVSNEQTPSVTGVPQQERPSESLQDFIDRILPGALNAEKQYNFPVAVTLAQAILESDQGRSGLALKYNNLFGIKARPGERSASMGTKEFLGGRVVEENASWKVYDSWAESVEDHGRFTTGPRYKAQGIGSTKSPDEVAQALQRAGYATDPEYADKLIGIMKRYNLYQYGGSK